MRSHAQTISTYTTQSSFAAISAIQAVNWFKSVRDQIGGASANGVKMDNTWIQQTTTTTASDAAGAKTMKRRSANAPTSKTEFVDVRMATTNM